MEEEDAPLALESLGDYIRRHGITSNDDAERNGEFNGLTRNEAAMRIDEEKSYFDSVVWKYLDEHIEGEKNNIYASLIDYQQSDIDDEAAILVLLANGLARTAKAKPFVSLCETVKRAVVSRSHFGVAECDRGTENFHQCKKQPKEHILQLSLIEFDSTAVIQFIDAIVSLFQHYTLQYVKNDTERSDSEQRSRKHRINYEMGTSSQIQHVIQLIENNKISEDHIIECLRISHYLQCGIMLDALATVLGSSVDSKNCISICYLADFYDLPTLFETSVNHVVSRLDALHGKPNEENEDICNNDVKDERVQQEIWMSLPHELRSRILTMRNIMRSSVIGKGSKISEVFFSSGDEFLAIFRETLCDLRERLAEARERRSEVIREREAEWDFRRERLGRWFDSSENARHAFIYSGDLDYALSKIQKQEERIQTLESFYQEQKLIFRSNSFGNSNVVLCQGDGF